MSGQTRMIRGWTAVWSTMFALNAIVPVVAGFDATRHGGVPGMLAALWVLWVAGVVAGALSARVRAAFLPGAVVLTLLQCVPVVHLVAFAVGAVVAAAVVIVVIPGGFKNPVAEPMAFFTMTLVTGQLLIGFAVAVGWLIVRNEYEPSEPDPGEEG